MATHDMYENNVEPQLSKSIGDLCVYKSKSTCN